MLGGFVLVVGVAIVMPNIARAQAVESHQTSPR
jgi:hypothetical protein